jgi:hypothetical protein
MKGGGAASGTAGWGWQVEQRGGVVSAEAEEAVKERR